MIRRTEKFLVRHFLKKHFFQVFLTLVLLFPKTFITRSKFKFQMFSCDTRSLNIMFKQDNHIIGI